MRVGGWGVPDCIETQDILGLYHAKQLVIHLLGSRDQIVQVTASLYMCAALLNREVQTTSTALN